MYKFTWLSFNKNISFMLFTKYISFYVKPFSIPFCFLLKNKKKTIFFYNVKQMILSHFTYKVKCYFIKQDSDWKYIF